MKFFGMKFNVPFKSHDLFTDDLRKSSSTNNPTLIAEIDLVYVLSGRTTVLGNDADGLKREFDRADDLERVSEGIRIAININALRANKRPEDLILEDYVIPIFYNGRTIHNKDLKTALKSKLLPFYPESLFIIRNIKPENTIGQIQSFSDYIAKNEHKKVAVVSSAYHLPRVGRTIGFDSPQVTKEIHDEELTKNPYEQWIESPLGPLQIFMFGIHKNEKRPGIIFDLQGEHSAMQRYSSGDKPSISKYTSNNVFFTDVDVYQAKSFSAALFWGNKNTIPLESDVHQHANSEESEDLQQGRSLISS